MKLWHGNLKIERSESEPQLNCIDKEFHFMHHIKWIIENSWFSDIVWNDEARMNRDTESCCVWKQTAHQRKVKKKKMKKYKTKENQMERRRQFLMVEKSNLLIRMRMKYTITIRLPYAFTWKITNENGYSHSPLQIFIMMPFAFVRMQADIWHMWN